MNTFEQGLLRYLSAARLRKIRSFSIGIAGSGGLGSNIAMCLVRSGFNDFTLADKDTIEPGNLNRQYFFIDEIGRPKVEALKRRMLAVNPDAHITARRITLTAGNIKACFSDRAIVFEAFDGADDKKMLVEAFAGSAAIIISGNGMAGLTSDPPLTIKKIHGRLFIVGDHVTRAGPRTPPFAPRVVACAALMAGVALELACQKTILCPSPN